MFEDDDIPEFDDESGYGEEQFGEEELDIGEVMEAIAEQDEMAEMDPDDDDDDRGDREEEMAEFLPLGGLGLGAGLLASRMLRRKRVRRAKPRQSYTRRVRGRKYGVIRTPAGKARVRLPGRFPTIVEFRRTVGAIQRDIKKNSSGIKDLVAAQKRVASLANRSDKGLEKKVFGLQVAVVALAVFTLPQAQSLIKSITS